MKTYKADLHIHTLLSPCASLEMSPKNIVKTALEQELDIIGITDHNSTRQCEIVTQEAAKKGLKVYCGVEVTSKEEIHCLAFFSTTDELIRFQGVIDSHLPDVKNNPDLFGYQVVVDEFENIVFEEEKLLISALNIGIDNIEWLVHDLNGVFIPAHVNKSKDSIISQLGFIPSTLNADALEITRYITEAEFLKANPLSAGKVIIRNSDAHHPSQIGESVSYYEMESTEFSEFRLALKNLSGRKVVLQ